MKIAFVNDSCERLGVEYISAVLKSAGHQTKLFADPQLFDDENITFKPLSRFFDCKKKIISGLKAYKPDLVGISVVTDFYQWACTTAKMIKEEMDVPIIFGGIHPTSVPERVIKNDFVDMVCVGEGEYPVLELANSMKKGSIDYSIKNIWFKRNGQIIQNEVRPLIEDLDSLPMPDKDLFYSASPHFSQCYYIMTSRGCTYSCSYCCHSYLKKIYKNKGTYLRRRSVENVIQELKIAKERYGIDMLRFHDDDLLSSNIGWFEEFAHRYKSYINLPYACFIHPNTLTEEKAKLLKFSGCHDVEIGIQSISEKTRLEILNRPVSHKQLVKAIQILNSCGLNIITDNILGIPNQNIKEIIDLLKFHNENRVMKIYCFGFRHYPKTDIIEYSRKYFNLSNTDITNLEDGINVKAFIQGGDIFNREIKQLQTFFPFLLYFPKSMNNFLIKLRLYRFFPSLPYFITVIFSNWLRIPYRYNWALHITISRYRHFALKKLRGKFYFSKDKVSIADFNA